MFEANTLILGSGGTLAYGLLGALAYLDAGEHLSKIQRYVGVSVGAIIAVLLAAGIDLKTVVKIFFDSHFSQLQSLSPVTLLSSYGLDSGARLTSKIAEVFGQSGLSKHVTFAQMKHVTGKDLVIGTCDILDRKFVLMSADTTPDVQVLDAVRASHAIPMIYAPKTIGDRVYVDGALMCSYPVSRCLLHWPDSKIIGLRVSQQCGRKRKIEGILDYIQTIFGCVGSPSEWECHGREGFRDILVEVDVGSMLSSPSHQDKMRMFGSGFEAAKAVFPPPLEEVLP